jgi:hypothetical protein
VEVSFIGGGNKKTNSLSQVTDKLYPYPLIDQFRTKESVSG